MMQRFIHMSCQAWKDHYMKLFLIALTLIVFVSCKKETTASVDTQTVALNNCSEEPAENLSYRLCFDSLLEDSRCPVNAVCVWQGAAKAKFRFKVNNQEHLVRLSTISMAPHYSTDTTVA